jgi:hypothetical protein
MLTKHKKLKIIRKSEFKIWDLSIGQTIVMCYFDYTTILFIEKGRLDNNQLLLHYLTDVM